MKGANMSVNKISTITPFWARNYEQNDSVQVNNSSTNPIFDFNRKPFDFGVELERQEAVKAEEAEKPEEQDVVEHTVKKGECVWDIAAKYLREYNDGKKPKKIEILEFTKEIMKLNDLEFDNTRNPKNWYVMIKPGQVLKIPAKKEEQEVVPVEPEVPQLTKEEIADAQESGSQIAGYLTNMWTTGGDQKHVKNIIETRVNERNVLEVLRGYEEGKRFSGDSFFEQLCSEWGFDEKKDLIVNVAKKLKTFLETNNMKELADKIEIKDAKDVDRNYAKQLDAVVKESITAYDNSKASEKKTPEEK